MVDIPGKPTFFRKGMEEKWIWERGEVYGGVWEKWRERNCDWDVLYER